ncbi:MAG: hypothetical protein CVV64_17635 [Candidatus Wallbacteria bacterium HGW-Wallbacteria-1]|jgi:hypothetical protein|uniref:DUF7033 domain-containing protein n=1 Tax=Candidatus Wallbacteria bacterium HGW-Wallbacteria-1 TaxID=2013854 RepID=A0A2N1PK84_9BACT|nr:MAG: hypothetical protein CVV64_17635 [Candidatus Wallbacteria bacterium HGW-Wallbacteria-1]
MSCKIEIELPFAGFNELSWTVSVLFGDILGLDYSVKPWDRPLHRFTVSGQGHVDLTDSFFNRFSGSLDYLSTANIPSCVAMVNTEFCPERDLPVLFIGPVMDDDAGMELSDGGLNIMSARNSISWDCDILASAFFMLSRWEETAAFITAGYPERMLAAANEMSDGPGAALDEEGINGRAYRWSVAAGLVHDHLSEKPWPEPLDQHGRFPATASLAAKCGFLNRPIVNEYAMTLLSMLRKVGFDGGCRQKGFSVIPTHDVDWVTYSKPWITVAYDLLKRHSPVLAMERVAALAGIGNPWDKFDWLMGVSEAAGVKSRFYLMAAGEHCLDGNCGRNRESLARLVSRIRARNHEIGFHPGYSTFEDHSEWIEQKERLEEILGTEVKEGRQHYLRCAAPWTWRVWEEAGMEIDSTMGYADQQGFRCGTGDTYRLFDVLLREPMKLRERPLVMMDGTLAHYRGFDSRGALSAYSAYRTVAHKYSTDLTMLIHNSHLDNMDWKGWSRAWKEFMVRK